MQVDGDSEFRIMLCDMTCMMTTLASILIMSTPTGLDTDTQKGIFAVFVYPSSRSGSSKDIHRSLVLHSQLL